ncbi:putative quinone oxidoreductase [Halotydeus destructor]|nr:putative quinone oxidoreductase [Halotydeus destructor]
MMSITKLIRVKSSFNFGRAVFSNHGNEPFAIKSSVNVRQANYSSHSEKTFSKLQVTTLSTDFRKAVKVVEVPLKDPEPDQVLVKVKLCGTNATDINVSAGRYAVDSTLPLDIGLEALGVVEKVGANVTSLTVGQPVAYLGHGGYAEYLYKPAAQLFPVPAVDSRFLACLLSGLTASTGLDTAGKIQRGDKVLITAAAGGAGQFCVQWAKSKGCHVIGTCSSSAKADHLLSIGCDKVINYKTEDLDQVLSKDYPEGVDVIWETIGGKTFEMLTGHLANFGRMVVIGAITGYKTEGFSKVTINPWTMIRRGQSIIGFALFNTPSLHSDYLAQLTAKVVDGSLKVKIDDGQDSQGGKLVGLESAVRAVEYMHSGTSVGKVVVEI